MYSNSPSMKKTLLSSILVCSLSSAFGQIITTYAGSGIGGSAGGGYGGDGGPAAAASLYFPTSVILDLDRNVIFTDRMNHRVRKVDRLTGIVTTIAGIGTYGCTGDGGPATAAQLWYPVDLAIDAAGNIYVSEWHNVRKISTSGIITTYAGSPACSPGYGGDGGPASAALLNEPNGITIDAANNLYIAESYGNRIRKVDAGGTITTIAGTGSAGTGGDGAAATAASLSSPWDVVVDASGNLYISDDQRIRKVNTYGVISTFAGPGVAGVFGDGGPATAAFISSGFLSIDNADNIYLANHYTNTLRKVTPGGIIDRIAGQYTYTSLGLGDGGSPLFAVLSPTAAVVDPVTNEIFIADEGNNRIRKIDFSTSSVSTFSPDDNVAVFPNPAANNVSNIIVESGRSIDRIAIVDNLGRCVLSTRGDGQKSVTIDISLVSPGIYTVTIDGLDHSKFVRY